ncbi:MAG: NAD(P)/FAD-dependent oxidoreductase [Bacteroidales bacterium]|nr:NAD(P)/FAD-dependent oxidoreductase [Bacteroidales bacterium]MBN2762944.1 NAD(P)/FAD-dependent oxidoreductase [Bacteroidales bacterium]
MKYDIIIIGAGLGGLTAGAKLAREGKKVLVIEQHDRPGGYATTFDRGDFVLEVGLHEMYGPSPGDMKTKIFNDLDVFSRVEFLPLPEFYRFTNDRIDITIPHDPVIAAERLSKLFPEETAGINAYFTQILKPKKKVFEDGQQEKSLGEFLDSIIHNDDLKLVLLGNLGYFHDDPYTLSLSYYSVSQGSYFTGGASFIKGGSQKLSDHLAGYIREHGGEVLLNHLVTGIRAENGKITSVLYKQNMKKQNDVLEAMADEIIANTAMPNLISLLPEEYGLLLKDELKHQQTGASLLTVYFGFSKPLKESGHRYYSTFVYDSTIKSQKDILKNNHEDFNVRNFTFIDYSQVDSGLAPPGKSVGTLCCIDYLKDWENLDRAAYLAKKDRVASVFTERLERLIPGVKNIIAYCEVGTPYSLRRYTLNPEGAVYGFAQAPARKTIDTSKLPGNLHFASAWGKTGGGFSGAIYGGYLCALGIMRKKP